jgi:hypothetical protein
MSSFIFNDNYKSGYNAYMSHLVFWHHIELWGWGRYRRCGGEVVVWGGVGLLKGGTHKGIRMTRIVQVTRMVSFNVMVWKMWFMQLNLVWCVGQGSPLWNSILVSDRLPLMLYALQVAIFWPVCQLNKRLPPRERVFYVDDYTFLF